MSERMDQFLEAAGEVWTDIINPRTSKLSSRSDWRQIEDARLMDLGRLVGLTETELDPSRLSEVDQRRQIQDAVATNEARGTEIWALSFLRELGLSLAFQTLYTPDRIRWFTEAIPEIGAASSRSSRLTIHLDVPASLSGDLLDRETWNYLYRNLEANRPLSAPIEYEFLLKVTVGRDTVDHTNPNTGLRYRKTALWQPQFDSYGNPIPYTMDMSPVLQADAVPPHYAWDSPSQPFYLTATFMEIANIDNSDTALSAISGKTYKFPINRLDSDDHYIYRATIEKSVALDWSIQGFNLYDDQGRAFYLSEFDPIEKLEGFLLTFEILLPKQADTSLSAPVVSVDSTTNLSSTVSRIIWSWTSVPLAATYETSPDGQVWTSRGNVTTLTTQTTPNTISSLYVRGVLADNTAGAFGSASTPSAPHYPIPAALVGLSAAQTGVPVGGGVPSNVTLSVLQSAEVVTYVFAIAANEWSVSSSSMDFSTVPGATVGLDLNQVLNAPGRYTLRAWGVNAQGIGPETSITVDITPALPTNFQIVSGPTWEPSSSTYAYQVSADGDFFIRIVNVSGTELVSGSAGSSLAISGLIPGATYSFAALQYLPVVGGEVRSSSTTALTGSVPAAPPTTAPSVSVVQAGNTNPSTSFIDWAWTSVPGAETYEIATAFSGPWTSTGTLRSARTTGTPGTAVTLYVRGTAASGTGPVGSLSSTYAAAP